MEATILDCLLTSAARVCLCACACVSVCVQEEDVAIDVRSQEEWRINAIPLDYDVMTMHKPRVFRQLAVDRDRSALKDVALTIMHLQVRDVLLVFACCCALCLCLCVCVCVCVCACAGVCLCQMNVTIRTLLPTQCRLSAMWLCAEQKLYGLIPRVAFKGPAAAVSCPLPCSSKHAHNHNHSHLHARIVRSSIPTPLVRVSVPLSVPLSLCPSVPPPLSLPLPLPPRVANGCQAVTRMLQLMSKEDPEPPHVAPEIESLIVIDRKVRRPVAVAAVEGQDHGCHMRTLGFVLIGIAAWVQLECGFISCAHVHLCAFHFCLLLPPLFRPLFVPPLPRGCATD